MRRKSEIRFTVVRDYFNEEIGDYYTETYPILFGTKEEAEKRMEDLSKGSDPSWHDPENGILYASSVEI